MDLARIRRRLERSYEKNAPEILALTHRLYPRFVFAAHPGELAGEVPVFHFHDADTAALEAQLGHLARNGYRTLTSAEFAAAMRGEGETPERSVVLTFDDGWRSLHTRVAPLLRHHGLKAVAYLIPGIMEPAREAIPSGSDAGVLVTWEDVRAIADVIDVQTHSHWHARVFISPRLVDFIHPGFDRHARNLHVPLLRSGETDDFTRQAPLGTPVYASAPRFGGRLRYFDDEEAREFLVAWVAAHGGAVFFAAPGWRRSLRQVLARHQESHPRPARYESREEQRAAIAAELTQSRAAIESELPGHAVHSLCFPWFVGSDIAVEIARDAGFTSAMWGVQRGRPTNRPGDDPLRTVRIPSEYIVRLPGRGRRALASVLAGMVRKSGPGLIHGL